MTTGLAVALLLVASVSIAWGLGYIQGRSE